MKTRKKCNDFGPPLPTREPRFNNDLEQYYALSLASDEVFGDTYSECLANVTEANRVAAKHTQETNRQKLHRELITEINAMTPEEFNTWAEQEAQAAAEIEDTVADLREWVRG